MTRVHLVTPQAPGAIALLQLQGPEVPRVLADLTGKTHMPDGRARLCRFGDLDEGLVVLRPTTRGEPWAQLMPHGGPRVVQRLIDRLAELGCVYDPTPDPRSVYPEAASPIEADLLATIALAASPAAIDLLAAQPGGWRRWVEDAEPVSESMRSRIQERAAVLDRLLMPPTVVVVGPANVGKSTLTNALMGRAVSIVADLPGTTRDWVGGLVELVPEAGVGLGGTEVAVRWLDTPGLRTSSDGVEQRAIGLARSVIEQADLLIAMRDDGSGWPGPEGLPREPDLWLLNKCDAAPPKDPSISAGDHADRPLRLSAQHGHGLRALQQCVLDRLGLSSLDEDGGLWAFSPTLRRWAGGEAIDLAGYLRGFGDRDAGASA